MIFTRESMRLLIHRWRAVLYHERFGLGVVIGTWAVFFSRIISGNAVYWLDDLKIIYYPLEFVYAQFQATGSLPVWSNLFGFGQPLLGWGQLGFFTPLHVLLRLLGVHPLNLLQVSIVTYFGIGVVGMYVWLRHQKLVPLIAASGAVVFTFSGFNIGHLNHINFFVGTMLLPWLLLVIDTFINHPTARRAALLSIVVSCIAVSSQPQVTLYSMVIASIWGCLLLVTRLYHRQQTGTRPRYLAAIIPLTIIAALVALSLAALNILPLQEFLPLTERADDLPVTELLDFSYPPSHAVTLVLPYFFGDHERYWGAKGFQELAAFVGIIPLLLASLAVTSWRQQSLLRTFGVLLVGIGVTFALGRYSPVYTYLVTNHLWPNLNIPGRFVFFVTTGIALLAALGLYDLKQPLIFHPKTLLRLMVSLAIPTAIFVPFIRQVNSLPTWHDRFIEIIGTYDRSLILLGVGVALYLVTFFWRRHSSVLLTSITALTLIIFGWNYNPVTSRSTAFASSFITSYFQQTRADLVRLYTRNNLIVDAPQTKTVSSPEIDRTFSAWQEVVVTSSPACWHLPFEPTQDSNGTLLVGLHSEVTAPASATRLVASHTIRPGSDYLMCFTRVTPGTYYLSFTSNEPSGLTLRAHATVGTLSSYWVRLAQPTPDQLQASQKELAFDITSQNETFNKPDPESILMARHLNVTAGASSARWIGALSIEPYRQFIEFFLGNDKDEIYDGSGQHVLEQNRRIADLAGINYLAGEVPPGATDQMTNAGFTVAAEQSMPDTTYRLYTNPTVFPKVFFVPVAEFVPADDDTRAKMVEPDFDPAKKIFIAGAVPPDPTWLTNDLGVSNLTITEYRDTLVTITTTTEQPGWVVITDVTTPQWHATVDGQPTPHFKADTIYKTAYVPAGSHTVTFSYLSPAIVRAKQLTMLGVIGLIVLVIPWRQFLGWLKIIDLK